MCNIFIAQANGYPHLIISTKTNFFKNSEILKLYFSLIKFNFLLQTVTGIAILKDPSVI